MIRRAFVLSVSLLLAACSGGGGGTPEPPPAVSVTLSPAAVNLALGGTQAFVATVSNAGNPGVTWSVAESGGGSVTGAGLYTAPTSISGASAIYHVVATAVADPSKSAAAVVTVQGPVAVTISPATASLVAGGTQQFTATVQNSASQAVTWSLQEGAAAGSIDAQGLYTAPAAVSGSAAFHVVATSAADASKSATATVVVGGSPVIASFTASPSTIQSGQGSTLAWTVTGANALSINQGVGAVTGSSVAVRPAQTTIYTLTASNGQGSVDRSVTVTVQAPSGNLALLAGDLGGAGVYDGPGSAARFNQPWAVAVDGQGNRYLADTGNNVIRKVAPDGQTSTLAGVPGAIGGYQDGPAASARFASPTAVLCDASGNLYVGEQRYLRKISAAGVVTTLAGNGSFGGQDGTGTQASFGMIYGLAWDGAGNLVVADGYTHTVRRVTPAGVVTTLAGSAGQSGSADGIGAAARFNAPRGVAVDGAGSVYVADSSNHTVRRIAPDGTVSTLAGSAGQLGFQDGSGSAARFCNPSGLVLTADGKLAVADGGNHAIRRVTATGSVSTLAGNGSSGAVDSAGAAARFNAPVGLAVDAAGNLLVTEIGNHDLRQVTAAAVVSTPAGVPPRPGALDGSGASARFDAPFGIALDASGAAYVADFHNYCIRRIAADGTVSTWAGALGGQGQVDGSLGTARFMFPYGIATDGLGSFFISDNGTSSIRRISPASQVSTLAGGSYGSTDGQGTAAKFKQPKGLAVDAAGNVYVADSQNHTIRRITPSGLVTTFAGVAGIAGAQDGPAASATFSLPYGVALDGAGNLYVAEFGNHAIRRITPQGVVSLFAGSAPGSQDGQGGAAQFNRPTAIAWESGSQTLLVVDNQNALLRRIALDGTVTTVAGQRGQSGGALGALPGVLGSLNSLAVGAGGRLVLTMQNAVVELRP